MNGQSALNSCDDDLLARIPSIRVIVLHRVGPGIQICVLLGVFDPQAVQPILRDESTLLLI